MNCACCGERVETLEYSLFWIALQIRFVYCSLECRDYLIASQTDGRIEIGN